MVGVSKPDESVTTTVYDNKQRVTSTVERTVSGVVITGFEYVYDDLSNIIEEKVLANSTKLCYTYDNLSRVTARTIKKLSDNSIISTETFSYDAAGNVTSAHDSSYQYDTKTHPFQVKGRGWVNAADLNPNDIVYTQDWNTATVKSVNLLELDEPVEVFNFEVEDCHTYFVGDSCILVHNLGCTQTNTSGVGQKHHPFSRKIVRAANDNPKLKGHVTRNSGTVKALTADGHKGYQAWHRELDDNIVKWIGDNKTASLSDFTNYMNQLYSDSKIVDIFGPVFFG